MSGELHEVSVAIGRLTASLEAVERSLETGTNRFDSLEKTLSEVKAGVSGLKSSLDGYSEDFRNHVVQEAAVFAGYERRLVSMESLRAKGIGFIAGISFVASLIGANLTKLPMWFK